MAAPPATSSAISPSAMPLISPSALLQAHLSQSPPLRPSSRLPSQTRRIHLNTSSLTHCNGSALVKLGESTIVCGVRAELLPVSEIAHYRASEASRRTTESTTHETEDYSTGTLNNLLVPNLELGTNVHLSFPANVAPSVTAQSISQRVLSLLHSSQLVRVADLEIRHTATAVGDTNINPDDPAYVEPERDVLKAYWVLYIDCVALGYGGESNIFDTTVLAVFAALKDVKLPKARWDGDDKRILCDADIAHAKRLSFNVLPCPLSYGVFVMDKRLGLADAQTKGQANTRNEDVFTLVDMDAFEDGVCHEQGSVVVDCSTGRTKILRLEKSGGRGALGPEAVRAVVALAEKRWVEWKKLLDNTFGGG